MIGSVLLKKAIKKAQKKREKENGMMDIKYHHTRKSRYCCTGTHCIFWCV